MRAEISDRTRTEEERKIIALGPSNQSSDSRDWDLQALGGFLLQLQNYTLDDEEYPERRCQASSLNSTIGVSRTVRNSTSAPSACRAIRPSSAVASNP